MGDYVYVVQLAVAAEHERAFNDLYDGGYIPALLAIPGVESCTRYRLEWADAADMPEYLAIYRLDDPEIPRSEAWKRASLACGWAERIRPHLTVRRHSLYRSLADG